MAVCIHGGGEKDNVLFVTLESVRGSQNQLMAFQVAGWQPVDEPFANGIDMVTKGADDPNGRGAWVALCPLNHGGDFGHNGVDLCRVDA